MLREIFSRTLSYFSSLSRGGAVEESGALAGLEGRGDGCRGALLVRAGPAPHPRLTAQEQQLSFGFFSGFLFPSNKSDTLPLATRYKKTMVSYETL